MNNINQIKKLITSRLPVSDQTVHRIIDRTTAARDTRAHTHTHQQSSRTRNDVAFDISIDPTIPSSLDGCIMTCHDSPLSVHALPHAPPRILGICRRSTAAASLALPRAASTTHRATADRLCARTGNMIMTSLSPWNICPATRTSLRLRAALLASTPLVLPLAMVEGCRRRSAHRRRTRRDHRLRHRGA